MAATFHQSGLPLQAIGNRGPDFCSPFRIPVQGSRKSAVELLQETKALYVKSNAVLVGRQEFSSDTSSNGNSNSYKDEEKPKLVPLRRSNVSACSDQLQAKLRKLLNVDSKENLQDTDSCSGDSWWKSERVGRAGCKSLPDLTTNKEIALTSTRGKPGRRKSSGDSMNYSYLLSSSSTIRGVSSSLPFGELSEEEESHTNDSAESSEDSSSKSYGKPPSLGSVSLGGSTSKVEIRKDGIEGKGSIEWEGEVLDIIPRSKSDLAWKEMQLFKNLSQNPSVQSSLHSVESPSDQPPEYLPPPSLPCPASLDDFFAYLGLGQPQYVEEIETWGGESGVYFSSGSSVESGSPRRRVTRRYDHSANSETSESSDSGSRLRTQSLSIVERNARVIKWICNCNKSNFRKKTNVTKGQ